MWCIRANALMLRHTEYHYIIMTESIYILIYISPSPCYNSFNLCIVRIKLCNTFIQFYFIKWCYNTEPFVLFPKIKIHVCLLAKVWYVSSQTLKSKYCVQSNNGMWFVIQFPLLYCCYRNLNVAFRTVKVNWLLFSKQFDLLILPFFVKT